MGTDMVKVIGCYFKAIEVNKDKRGHLSEVYREDWFKEMDIRPRMCYVSVTKPGEVRGPHMHRYQTDYFCFSGPGDFKLYLWDQNGNYGQFVVGESNPTFVIVPPGVVHGYKNISDFNDGLVINLPNQLYKGLDKSEEVDEVRFEDSDESPYVID